MQNASGDGTSVAPNSSLIRVADWSDLRISRVRPAIYSALCTYTALIMVVSVILNGAVILITFKRKVLRKPLNYMLLNLSVADILNATIGGAVSTAANAAGKFYLGKIWCNTYAFLVGTFGIVNLTTIVLLSVSRYVVICKSHAPPLRSHHVLIAITATSLWSALWSAVPLFFDYYDLEGVGTSCGVIANHVDRRTKSYLICYFAFCFALPLFIMFVAYALILFKIWKVAGVSEVSGSVNGNMSSETTKMVAVIVLAFLVCWTPYACVAVHVALYPGIQVNQYVAAVPAYIAKSSTMYNPVIYALMNRKFRYEMHSYYFQTPRHLHGSLRISSCFSRHIEISPFRRPDQREQNKPLYRNTAFNMAGGSSNDNSVMDSEVKRSDEKKFIATTKSSTKTKATGPTPRS